MSEPCTEREAAISAPVRRRRPKAPSMERCKLSTNPDTVRWACSIAAMARSIDPSISIRTSRSASSRTPRSSHRRTISSGESGRSPASKVPLVASSIGSPASRGASAPPGASRLVAWPSETSPARVEAPTPERRLGSGADDEDSEDRRSRGWWLMRYSRSKWTDRNRRRFSGFSTGVRRLRAGPSSPRAGICRTRSKLTAHPMSARCVGELV